MSPRKESKDGSKSPGKRNETTTTREIKTATRSKADRKAMGGRASLLSSPAPRSRSKGKTSAAANNKAWAKGPLLPPPEARPPSPAPPGRRSRQSRRIAATPPPPPSSSRRRSGRSPFHHEGKGSPFVRLPVSATAVYPPGVQDGGRAATSPLFRPARSGGSRRPAGRGDPGKPAPSGCLCPSA